MNEQKIAAMLDLAQGDEPWSKVGEDLGEFLDMNTRDRDAPADVVLEVSYIPEDDDVLLRLPCYMSIWLPRWQLEAAIERAKGAKE